MKNAYRLAVITARTKSGMTKSFACACGKVHVLGAYVFAHWNDALVHTCECGRKNIIKSGVAQTPHAAPQRRIKQVRPPRGCMRHRR